MHEIVNRLNWVDIVSLILLIKIGYVSSHIGVGKQILPLILLTVIVAIALYNYAGVAYFFVEKFSLSPSLCNFVSFASILLILCVVYRFVLRMTGFYLFAVQTESWNVERIGGVVIGILRSVVIIGAIFTVAILSPLRFVEDGIKKSYTGYLFVNANLDIYSYITHFFSDGEASRKRAAAGIFSQNKDYFLDSPGILGKSRFYREEF